MLKRTVSPRELAEAIGVSESSLKRWTDNGSLVASRTVGGHRKILLTEALRFIRETRTPLVRPEVLGLADVARAMDDVFTTGSDAQRLYAYLLAGRAAEARGLLSAVYLSGQSIAQVCDGALREALARVGELWTHDPRGIYLEHRAFEITLQALHQLRALLPAASGPVRACGGALAGDPYILPSLAVALTLQSENVAAANIGANTPLAALEIGAQAAEIRLVWISVSHVPEETDVARQIETLASSLATRGVPLVIGGRASHELPLTSIQNVVVLPTLGALVEFVRENPALAARAGGSEAGGE